VASADRSALVVGVAAIALGGCGTKASPTPSLPAALAAYCSDHASAVTFAIFAELKLPLPGNLALDTWDGQTVSQVEATGVTEQRIRDAVFLHPAVAQAWHDLDSAGYAAGCARAYADGNKSSPTAS
jgi:hypothetical protein